MKGWSKALQLTIANSGVGAFEVVEEAVKELSVQHELEIKSLRQVLFCCCLGYYYEESEAVHREYLE